jgi:antitoxin MazE
MSATENGRPLSTEMFLCIYCVYTLLEPGMITQFRKWGNSLAVRIPKPLADAVKASDGRRAEIIVENGTLVLRPIAKAPLKSRYTLRQLLRGMAPDNVPQDVDWGPRRDNEVW